MTQRFKYFFKKPSAQAFVSEAKFWGNDFLQLRITIFRFSLAWLPSKLSAQLSCFHTGDMQQEGE